MLITKTQTPYSSFISAVKTGLLLLAVALLASIFIFSRADILRQDVLVTDQKTLDLAQEQKATVLSYSGTSARGDTYAIEAQEGFSLAPQPDRVELVEPSAQVNLYQGDEIFTRADKGIFDVKGRAIILSGGVSFATTDGVEMVSEYISLDLETGDVVSPGTVAMSSKFGELTAGSLQMINQRTSAHKATSGRDVNTILRFKRGVKLVYTPSGDR